MTFLDAVSNVWTVDDFVTVKIANTVKALFSKKFGESKLFY